MQNLSVTVLLESIVLLLLQLQVTRPKPLAQRVIPSYILIKTAYFNHVDIRASFKIFCQKSHLLVSVIIKLALLIRFTDPPKWSTFNVRLVPDKNFRTIVPTVFLVGVSTNWLKILSTIAHIFLNFTTNRTACVATLSL